MSSGWHIIHRMSSGRLSRNWYLIRMSYDNAVMSSGWHRLPFVSHPDEIANFDFPHHAVALQRFRTLRSLVGICRMGIKKLTMWYAEMLNKLTPIYKLAFMNMVALYLKQLCFTHCYYLNQEWQLCITPLIWHDGFTSPWRVSIASIPGDLDPSFRNTFLNVYNFIIFERKYTCFIHNEAKTLNAMLKGCVSEIPCAQDAKT